MSVGASSNLANILGSEGQGGESGYTLMNLDGLSCKRSELRTSRLGNEVYVTYQSRYLLSNVILTFPVINRVGFGYGNIVILNPTGSLDINV